MVKKLYKHEFIALSRMLLPIYAICLAIAGVFSLTLFLSDNIKDETVKSALNGLTGTVYVLSIIAVAVLTYILIVIRFYKSFAKDEAYLTMSLPVSTTTHMICKLLCGALFTFIGTAVSVVSLIIVGLGSGLLSIIMDIINLIKEILLTSDVLTQLTPLVLPYILSLVLGLFKGLLLPFAAVSLGQRASKSKLGMSVLWYFVFSIGEQIISSICTSVISFSILMEASSANVANSGEIAMRGAVTSLWISLLIAELATIFYFVFARYNFKNKLNLE